MGNPRPTTTARASGEGQISLVTSTGEVASSATDLLIVSCDEVPCFACVRQIAEGVDQKFEHEDETTIIGVDDQSLDDLEEYDATLLEDHSSDQALRADLCLPRHNDLEPEVDAETLNQLDDIADQVEIERLCGMSVLLPERAAEIEYPGQTATSLTTRMVRCWRAKELHGKPVWYRRSRYVAREFAWLSQRQDLFSPASTALCNRLLPSTMMIMQTLGALCRLI